jgi:hypothetical protein
VAETYEKGACNIFWSHFGALFIKRVHIYKRNFKGLLNEIFIPVLLVCCGFAIAKLEFFFDSPSRTITPNLFPLQQRILVNNNTFVSAGVASDNISPQQLMSSLPNATSAFKVTYKDYTNYV